MTTNFDAEKHFCAPKEASRERQLIIIAGSAGSISVVLEILRSLRSTWRIPIIILTHTIKPLSDGWLTHLRTISAINISEAEDQQLLADGNVYIAPHDFHLLVDADHCVHLDYSPRVFASRPSIDVLLISAAQVYRQQLTAILLSGANTDGALGMRAAANCGATTVVQAPEDSDFAIMPQAALRCMRPSFICTKSQLLALFKDMGVRDRRSLNDG